MHGSAFIKQYSFLKGSILGSKPETMYVENEAHFVSLNIQIKLCLSN